MWLNVTLTLSKHWLRYFPFLIYIRATFFNFLHTKLSSVQGVASYSYPRFWPKDSSSLIGSIHIQLSPSPSSHDPTGPHSSRRTTFSKVDRVIERVDTLLRQKISGLEELTIQVEGVSSCWCIFFIYQNKKYYSFSGPAFIILSTHWRFLSLCLSMNVQLGILSEIPADMVLSCLWWWKPNDKQPCNKYSKVIKVALVYCLLSLAVLLLSIPQYKSTWNGRNKENKETTHS